MKKPLDISTYSFDQLSQLIGAAEKRAAQLRGKRVKELQTELSRTRFGSRGHLNVTKPSEIEDQRRGRQFVNSNESRDWQEGRGSVPRTERAGVFRPRSHPQMGARSRRPRAWRVRAIPNRV